MLWGMSEALGTVDYEGAAASFASFLAGLAEIEEQDPVPESADRWDCDELAEDVATIGGAEWRPEVRVAAPEALVEPGPNLSPAASDKKIRKSASVTLRMTQEECVQLQQRATAAGLTMSAYVRSCVFEAEALRAQVKQALAQFSVAAAAAERKVMTSPMMKDEETQKGSSGESPSGERLRLRPRIFGRWAGSVL